MPEVKIHPYSATKRCPKCSDRTPSVEFLDGIRAIRAFTKDFWPSRAVDLLQIDKPDVQELMGMTSSCGYRWVVLPDDVSTAIATYGVSIYFPDEESD